MHRTIQLSELVASPCGLQSPNKLNKIIQSKKLNAISKPPTSTFNSPMQRELLKTFNVSMKLIETPSNMKKKSAPKRKNVSSHVVKLNSAELEKFKHPQHNDSSLSNFSADYRKTISQR